MSKRYGDRRALQDVAMVMTMQETLGIVGPNGAGKTTLLRMLVGLVQPDSGTVRVGGQPPPAGLAPMHVAYFGGESTLPPRTTAERWGRLLNPGTRPVSERRQMRVLSRGTRQLVGLEAALAAPNRKLLVLDEPWEGLDPDAARWLSRTLSKRRDQGAGIVVSSHRLHDLAGMCDRYGFLFDGRLVWVSAEEMRAPHAVTAETLLATYDRVHRGSP